MRLFEIEVAQGSRASDINVENKTLDSKLLSKTGYRKVLDDEDKDGAYFTASRIEGTRHNKNVIDCPILIFDIDSAPFEETKSALQNLRDDGLEFICYTTASHNKDVIDKETGLPENRYRILVPLENPLKGHEYKSVIVWAKRKYRIPCANESERHTIPMYYPTVKESGVGQQKLILHKGQPLEIDEAILALAKKKAAELDGTMPMPMVYPPCVPQAAFITAVYDISTVNNGGRDDWVNLGMAMHHQTNGKGIEAWDEWSSHDNRGRYNPSEIQQQWASFKGTREGGVKTLRNYLREEIAYGISKYAIVFSNLIKMCETAEELEKIRLYIIDESDCTDREIAGPINKMFRRAKRRISGVEMTERHSLFELRNGMVEDSPLHEYFHEHFLYMKNTNTYYELAYNREWNIKSFDYHFTRTYCQPNKDGVYKDASKEIQNGTMYERPRICEGYKYLPKFKKKLVELDDGLYVNDFDHEAWPKAGARFDPINNEIDAEVKHRVDIHFNILADQREEATKYLMQYLAHLRQKPGERIFHAFCLTSRAGGVGKTVLMKLYETVLGLDNVDQISKKTMQQGFDAFLGRRVLMQFVDEFDEFSRSKSEEAIRGLKSGITNVRGPVNPKYSDGDGSADFYSSYGLFSNNPSVLGSEGEDRRWSRFNVSRIRRGKGSKMADKTLEHYLGEERDDFFGRYTEMMDMYPERFAAYFDSIDIKDFSTQQGLKMEAETHIDESSYRFFIEKALQQALEMEDNNRITPDVIVLADLVEASKLEFRVEVGDDQKPSHNGFRNEAREVLLDQGYIVMGVRKRLPKLGFNNPTNPNTVYYKPDPKMTEEMRLAQITKKYG